MPYEGVHLNGKPFPKTLDWKRVEIVLVSGTGPNLCGHVLLYVGGGFGHYFQFTGSEFTNYPFYLNGENDYHRFLSENKKTEISRMQICVPIASAAQDRLQNLMNNKWRTFLVAHNCASFIEEVIHAGDSPWMLDTFCPAVGMGWKRWITYSGHPERVQCQ